MAPDLVGFGPSDRPAHRAGPTLVRVTADGPAEALEPAVAQTVLRQDRDEPFAAVVVDVIAG